MATRKIHFFTGKGGVGKSLVCAAYAYAFATKKKGSVLLTELSDSSAFNEIFKTQKGAEENGHSVTAQPHLAIEHWNTESCLREYAGNLLKSEAVAQFFLNNKISKSLINIAPGLRELAILGKATSSPRHHGPQTKYDEIFIDAYASGHFVSLISAPEAFSEIFKIGPMATQSKGISKYIKDPNFTQINIVALPTELAVTESIELFSKISERGQKPVLILNKYFDIEKLDLKTMDTKTSDYFSQVQKEQSLALKAFKKNKMTVRIIPYVPLEDSFEIIKTLSSRIAKNDDI